MFILASVYFASVAPEGRFRNNKKMAPKKNKDTLNDPAAGLTEEQQAALEVSQRLQAAAKTQGVGVTCYRWH